MGTGVRSGRTEEITLSDPEMEQVVRVLAASINVRMMDILLRRRVDDAPGGWMFLSEIAEAVGEAPGTVGLAVQKLLPLLEEKREKGKRYFRSRYRDIRIVMERVEAADT